MENSWNYFVESSLTLFLNLNIVLDTKYGINIRVAVAINFLWSFLKEHMMY